MLDHGWRQVEPGEPRANWVPLHQAEFPPPGLKLQVRITLRGRVLEAPYPVTMDQSGLWVRFYSGKLFPQGARIVSWRGWRPA